MCTRLTLEINRASTRARAKLAMLGKESMVTATKATTRLLTIELIQDHNTVDVLTILHQDSSVIGQNSSKLTSSKTRLDDALKSSMANIIFASSYLDLFEVKALVDTFRQLLGEKFIAAAASNRARICNARVVTKLTRPIEETLIQQYLQVVIQPSGMVMEQKLKPTAPKVPSAAKVIHPAECPTPMKPCNGEFPSQIPCLGQVCMGKNQPSSDQTITTSATVSLSKFAPNHPIHIFRPNKRLEIAFDGRTKNPVYVMERLDGRARTTSPTRRHNFYEDLRLPPEFRSRLDCFLHAGYDRGHMAPAADFGSGSVKDTFNLCNISPQDSTMNRSIWVKLEHWCRRVAEQELSSQKNVAVHVVTGPVWMPNTLSGNTNGPHHIEYMAIGHGDSLIHVPTHFFKIIVVSRHGGGDERIQKFACFLVPNQKSSTGTASRLEEFVIHWGRLESITGLQFFPKLVTPDWKNEARRATQTMMDYSCGSSTLSKPTLSTPIAIASSGRPLEHLRLE